MFWFTIIREFDINPFNKDYSKYEKPETWDQLSPVQKFIILEETLNFALGSLITSKTDKIDNNTLQLLRKAIEQASVEKFIATKEIVKNKKSSNKIK